MEIHVLMRDEKEDKENVDGMRDEKEERSKQGQTNNKAKQHSTCTCTYM